MQLSGCGSPCLWQGTRTVGHCPSTKSSSSHMYHQAYNWSRPNLKYSCGIEIATDVNENVDVKAGNGAVLAAAFRHLVTLNAGATGTAEG